MIHRERGRLSLRASLGAAAAILRICSPTVVEAARGTLTRANIDRRMQWWGEALRRYADVDFTCRGLENLPAEGEETFVMMSNHESLFDVPMIYRAIPRTIRMVTKKELFRIPIWGRALRESGFFEMDRNNRDRAIATLQGASRVLAEGINVWISPEGRRPKTPGLGPFKKGGFMLAIDAQTRILPIGISGTREVLPPGAARTRTGQSVAVVVGAPIDVVGKDRAVLMDEVRAAIEALIEEARTIRNKTSP
jgi:1-acyl-sn-glycerol-3-phosphate acyltransferase